MTKKLQEDIGQAIYEAACATNADLWTIDAVIGRVSDAMDAAGIDPEAFERAAGWDEEDRTKHRLRRLRAGRGE